VYSKCYVGQRHKHHLNRKVHIQMCQDFIQTHLIGVALETRKGRLGDVKGILCCSCLRLFHCVVFICELERSALKLWQRQTTIRDQQESSGKWGIRGWGRWLMAESAPFLPDTDCMNASPPTIPKRASSQEWRRECLGPEIKVRAGREPHWHN